MNPVLNPEEVREARERLKAVCAYEQTPLSLNWKGRVIVRGGLCCLGLGFLALGVMGGWLLAPLFVAGAFLAVLVLI